MLCRKPFIKVKDALSGKFRLYRPDVDAKDGIPIPCGQCLACRINKRRMWTLRLLLEYTKHERASFVTLTYDPANYPLSDESGQLGRGVLCKRDVQLFLKKVRKRFPDRIIRYYCAGEYGTKNFFHPHYHLILFGVDADELDPDYFYFGGKSGPIRKNYTRVTPLYELWNYGVVHVGEVTAHSIGYTAGYVTSKLTRKNDGFTPEFALMSRMPGLGLSALEDITRYLQKVSEDRPLLGAPRQIRVDGHLWPTGRYLLSKLGSVLDFPDGSEEYIAHCSTLYRESQSQGLDFLAYLVESDAQRFANLEKRQKLFKERKL